MGKQITNDLFKNVDLTLRELNCNDIMTQLDTCVSSRLLPYDTKVRILLADGRRWCVGKILAVSGVDDEPVIYMFPVPEEIGAVNERADSLARETCEKAASGQKCGTCPDLASCGTMARVTEKVREEFGGRKPDDLPGQEELPFMKNI